MLQMKTLILGCGKHYQKKYQEEVTVDIRAFPCVDIVFDLNITPWPFENEEFTSISAVHLVEHLNDLISFMDQCHKILCPGGSLYLETPLAGGDVDLEWADPTHKRCYRKHTFINYFTVEGVNRFGYTGYSWCIYHLEAKDGNLIFHGTPIKGCSND